MSQHFHFTGFVLADANYDVWLGNYRGNTYGLHHTSLNPNNKEFWKFRLYKNIYLICHFTSTQLRFCQKSFNKQ